jgi:predicted dehydrogenase
MRLHYPVLTERVGVTVWRVKLPWIEPGQRIVRGDWNAVLPSLAGLDLFIVGTPPHCQTQHVEALLLAGVPVLCEKPAGMDVAQAQRLATIADAAGTECRVNYQLRFHPAVQQACDLLRTETAASVQVTCTSGARLTRSGKPGWYWQPESGGGVWFSLLSHLIDLAHYLGLEPTEPEVTRAAPTAGPSRGIDALEVQARCQDGTELALTADAVADETTLIVRISSATKTSEINLASGNTTPWRVAFTHCAHQLVGERGINLAGCATLEDAMNVHRVVQATRDRLSGALR